VLAQESFAVYGGTSNHGFDARVLNLAKAVTGLDLQFSHLWYHTWADGEPGFRLDNPELIKDRNVIIFACPITYKLEGELRDLVTAAKQQYHARLVIVILPFLRFRRQDHGDLNHEITRLRWFIRNLKHWGADKLIVCEPHSLEHTKKYCEEFELELFVSDPTQLFLDTVRPVVQTLGGVGKVRIYSPDFGSVGRAIALAKLLGVSVLATPKQRLNGRIALVSDQDFLTRVKDKYGPDAPVSCAVDDLRGLHLFMREDEIDTAGTAVQTAGALRQKGAASVRLIATHPVCSRGWKMRLFPFGEHQPFEAIWLGNTRPRGNDETAYEGSTGGRIEEVDIAPVIAKTLVEVISGLA